MNVFNKKDALHKAELYDLLSLILDDEYLSKTLKFKGGTCAAMMKILDRFSIDLDFDMVDADINKVRDTLELVFNSAGLAIKDQSKNFIQYFLKYENLENDRSTIKLDVTDNVSPENDYKPYFLIDIGRYAICQTPETMFANKLFALKNRFDQNKKIAGRDLYDIDYFFRTGLAYKNSVIEERSGLTSSKFFENLIVFVEEHVTEKLIIQDLNPLVDAARIFKIRKTLKPNVLRYLKQQH